MSRYPCFRCRVTTRWGALAGCPSGQWERTVNPSRKLQRFESSTRHQGATGPRPAKTQVGGLCRLLLLMPSLSVMIPRIGHVTGTGAGANPGWGEEVTEWRRLSVRRGLVEDDGPYAGVPAHMWAPIHKWLSSAFMTRVRRSNPLSRGSAYYETVVDRDFVTHVATAVRIPITPDPRFLSELISDVIAACQQDADVALEVIDAVLMLSDGKGKAELQRILDGANSMWTVDADGTGIQERVDPTAVAAFQEAADPDDVASSELKQAWAKAYGRDQDPSDAWDHAIKAVEALVVPLVVPSQANPQFGHALGQLRSQGERWRFVLPGPDGAHDVGSLVSMLRLLWPNPDRHVSGAQRQPEVEEARAAVHLSILIVQWLRAGGLARVETSSS